MRPYDFYLSLIQQFRAVSGIELVPVAEHIFHNRLEQSTSAVRQRYMRWMKAPFRVCLSKARYDPGAMGLYLLSVIGPDPALFSAIEDYLKQPRSQSNAPA